MSISCEECQTSTIILSAQYSTYEYYDEMFRYNCFAGVHRKVIEKSKNERERSLNEYYTYVKDFLLHYTQHHHSS